jgi:hypothetical protein
VSARRCPNCSSQPIAPPFAAQAAQQEQRQQHQDDRDQDLLIDDVEQVEHERHHRRNDAGDRFPFHAAEAVHVSILRSVRIDLVTAG